MKLGERYLANIFYNRTTGPHFRVWRKCKQCCGIQTITFWRLAGKYLYCLHHVFAYICYLAFSFCKGWSGSQNLQSIINEVIHLFWALRQILEIFWRVSYLVLDATSWWGWSAICQSGRGRGAGATRRGGGWKNWVHNFLLVNCQK